MSGLLFRFLSCVIHIAEQGRYQHVGQNKFKPRTHSEKTYTVPFFLIAALQRGIKMSRTSHI